MHSKDFTFKINLYINLPTTRINWEFGSLEQSQSVCVGSCSYFRKSRKKKKKKKKKETFTHFGNKSEDKDHDEEPICHLYISNDERSNTERQRNKLLGKKDLL